MIDVSQRHDYERARPAVDTDQLLRFFREISPLSSLKQRMSRRSAKIVVVIVGRGIVDVVIVTVTSVIRVFSMLLLPISSSSSSSSVLQSNPNILLECLKNVTGRIGFG